MFEEVPGSFCASRDLNLCCLPELAGSSSGSVAGSWITIG